MNWWSLPVLCTWVLCRVVSDCMVVHLLAFSTTGIILSCSSDNGVNYSQVWISFNALHVSSQLCTSLPENSGQEIRYDITFIACTVHTDEV